MSLHELTVHGLRRVLGGALVLAFFFGTSGPAAATPLAASASVTLDFSAMTVVYKSTPGGAGTPLPTSSTQELSSSAYNEYNPLIDQSLSGPGSVGTQGTAWANGQIDGLNWSGYAEVDPGEYVDGDYHASHANASSEITQTVNFTLPGAGLVVATVPYTISTFAEAAGETTANEGAGSVSLSFAGPNLYRIWGTGEVSLSSNESGSGFLTLTAGYLTGGSKTLQIDGFAMASSDDEHYEPVPEPGTLLLVGTGLLGVVGLARRRFKN